MSHTWGKGRACVLEPISWAPVPPPSGLLSLCAPTSAHCLAPVRCLGNAYWTVAVFSGTSGPVRAESEDCRWGRRGQRSCGFVSGVVAHRLGCRFVLALCFSVACVFLSGSAVSFPFSVLTVNLVLNVLSSCTFLLAQPPLGCVAVSGQPLLPSWLSPRRCLSSPWPALPRPAFLASLLCFLYCSPSLFWCPLILSLCLHDSGLGLSKLKTWCFVTGPEHWHVRGTLRE